MVWIGLDGTDEVLEAAPEPIYRPRHHHVELALGGVAAERIESRALVATFLGQTGNPSPADGLQLFVTDKAGLSKDQITTMRREVTGKLLMG